MRPRIVIPVLGLGLLLTAAALLFRAGPSHTTPHRPPANAVLLPPTVAVLPAPAPTVSKPGPLHAPPRATGAAAGTESPQAREADYVQERVQQLMDLGMDDQPASLQTILSELNNREPAIRHAAVQAAVQFGSRDAIPQLRDALDQTADVREKAAIQDAIDFLKIPSAAEVAATRKAARPAR